MSPIATTILLLAAAGVFAYTMRRRIPPLLFARHEVRWDQPVERLKRLIRFGFGQGRMPSHGEKPAGFAHILIFAAFMVLAIRTVTLIGMGFSKDFHLPLLGLDQPLGMAYSFVKEIVVVGALLGVAVFLYFRWFQKKERMTLSKEGWIILLVIGSLMVTELMFEGGEIAHAGGGFKLHLFAASTVAGLFTSMGLSASALLVISAVGYWLHVFTILAFGNFLPYGKHFHIITGLGTVFLQRLPPTGVLSKLDLENSEQFGAAKVTDLSWKELLDTYSCTECGRCQTHCPTYVTGKPLSHKEVNRAIRHEIEGMAPDMPMPLLQMLKQKNAAAVEGEGAEATGPQLPEMRALVGEGGVIPDETIWACTTCGWCETACPVFIENVPRLIDMRRNKVLMEADFPAEAQTVFDGMENQSNPWGIGSNTRADWAEGLDVPVAANLAEAGNKFEYLFYVGCAGSFDDRQKKVTRSIFKILKEAKIDFAMLGNEEGCNGDSARRLGNEYLFQTMAESLIETLKKYEYTTIITQCPHCFNMIGNEYAEFGVKFNVIHHSQLINKILEDNKVKLTKDFAEGDVTFHDSCYLARYNGVTEEPRQVLKKVPKLKILEMPRNKDAGFCCGAGGGRMWLEEDLGARINQNRVDEAAGTGARVIATSCPFCLTMLRDGINETDRGEKMIAKDLAEIVADAMED